MRRKSWNADMAALRLVLQEANPHRIAFALSLLLGLSYAALNAAFFYSLRTALDRLLSPGGSIWHLALLLLGFYLLRALLFLGSEMLAISAIQEMVLSLRQRFLRGSLSRLHIEEPRGHRLDTFFEDIDQACGMVKLFSATLIKDLFTVVGLLVVLILFSPRLALVMVLIYGVAALPLVLLGRRVRRQAHRQRAAHAALMARLLELLSFRAEWRSLGLNPVCLGGTREMLQRQARQQTRLSFLDRLAPAAMELSAAIAFTALLLFAGDQLLRELSISGSIAFAGAGLALYGPLKNLGSFQAGLQRGLASAARVLPFLENESRGLTLPKTFRKITVTVDRCPSATQPVILEGIHFSAFAGETVAVVGPNGSGKTTLFRCLLGLSPFDGSLSVDTYSYAARTQRPVWPAGLIFYAGSQPALFDDTLAANLTCNRPYSDTQLHAVLQTVGLQEKLARVGLDLQTRIGEIGDRLSLGMRQRLVIGRAFLFRPRLLMLDEVFSAIESAEAVCLLRRLRETLPEALMFVVTRDRGVAADADRVLFFRQGRLVAQGRHVELIEVHKTYAAFWNLTEEDHATGLSRALSAHT